MSEKKSEPIDVVYVLGKGSRWHNNEIRYSLRSIQKNLIGYRNVFIVGENPGFTTNITHIPHPDELGPGNADGNIIRKVLRACKRQRLSDTFLFINDDHFIIKPTHVKDIPPLHKGDMTTFSEGYFKQGLWRKRLKRTRDHLVAAGLTAFHFDAHTPILFNKHLFPDAVSRFDYATAPGLTMKSLYGNVVYPGQEVPLTTQKVVIFKPKTIAEINQTTEQSYILSINDGGLNNSMRFWLQQTFPDPSKYESTPPSDFYIDLAQWVSGGKDADHAFQICEKHDKHLPLRIRARRNCQRSRQKINVKLDYQTQYL